MNPFTLLLVLARRDELEPEFDASYYRSETFRQRLSFTGADGIQDKVAIQLYLLSRLALDPAHTADTLSRMDQGLVLLYFFEFTNPIPVLELAPGSPEWLHLREAILANLASPRVRQVHRVRYWHDRRERSYRQECAVLDRLRETLPWPTPMEWKQDRAMAESRMQALCQEMNRKAVDLRNRRQNRMALLRSSTAPGVGSYLDLLKAIALHVLTPPEEPCMA